MKKIIFLLIVICATQQLFAQTTKRHLVKVTIDINGRGMNIIPHDFAEALRNKNSSPFTTNYTNVIAGFAKVWKVPKDSVIPMIDRSKHSLFDFTKYGQVQNSGVDTATGQIELSEYFILDKEPIYQDPITGRAWKESCANPLTIFVDPFVQPGDEDEDEDEDEDIADSDTLDVIIEDSIVYIPGRIDTIFVDKTVKVPCKCEPIEIFINCCPQQLLRNAPNAYRYNDWYYNWNQPWYQYPQQQRYMTGYYPGSNRTNSSYNNTYNNWNSVSWVNQTVQYNKPYFSGRPPTNYGFSGTGCIGCGGSNRPPLGGAGVSWTGGGNSGGSGNWRLRPPG